MATMGSMCLRSANRMANITRSYILRTQHMRSNLRQCTTTTTEKNNNTTEPPGSKMDKSAEKPETKQDEKTSAASEAEATLKKEKEKLEDTVKDMKVPGLFHRLRRRVWPTDETYVQRLWPFSRRKYVPQDKYIRALAETENVRQRMKKQVDDAKIFGIQGFCKDLLEVADILGKATESVPKEEVKDENIHLKNLFQGLTMTESQLLKVFNKHGLEQITPAEGEKFDPFIHEAMFEVPTANQEAASTIAVTTKVGYKLSDRTIRPALVGVFKAT
ncbi:grpE protein homolog 1, mitochondrial-like isoform X1 [Ylistrum balloti]|uniref:grpE protein homolog 1, mitochondrial-like isoform X1 n=1 Tax=Ylistrum balloti TaxID=509963 RepID=UPI002905AE45|nr:grpE protein homolog 1, mitochondrial-like isoform X1 [Ylistrum balloti]